MKCGDSKEKVNKVRSKNKACDIIEVPIYLKYSESELLLSLHDNGVRVGCVIAVKQDILDFITSTYKSKKEFSLDIFNPFKILATYLERVSQQVNE